MTWFKHIAKVDEKYMGVEGKKTHDFQMQFSSRIIIAIIIILLKRPSLVVKIIKDGCK
jgi:hypothetical protein